MPGEMLWARRMADKYHDTAKDNRVRIVHCCGFDSVPSDLGTLLVVDHLNKLGKYAALYHTVTHIQRTVCYYMSAQPKNCRIAYTQLQSIHNTAWHPCLLP